MQQWHGSDHNLHDQHEGVALSDSTPPRLPPRLFLRIQCPRCLNCQAVSLAEKLKSHPECDRCKSPIPLPRLNRKVRGLEVVLKASPAPEPVKIRLPCPGCASFLTVDPEVAGQRRRCPQCEMWFRLDLIKEVLPNDPSRNPALSETGPYGILLPDSLHGRSRVRGD
ncbi:MAG: hypothetical protein KDA84_08435 [Planctomycetaceae bacterium]|nr:hypothetical protein [Planctomycetaceae bacterium]